MIVADHVVRDSIKRVISRNNGCINRNNVEQIVRDILADIHVDVGGVRAKREGYIAAIGQQLVILSEEADGAKIVRLKPGTAVEIMTDDYAQPYLVGKVVLAPEGAPYMTRIEGPDIDPDTTPIVGAYARTTILISVTNPPEKQLPTNPQASRLAGPDGAEK